MYLRKWLCVAKSNSFLVPQHANPASKTQETKLNQSLFLLLCSSPSAETSYAKFLKNLHCSQNNEQEISWLGFKGMRSISAHASLGTEMKLEKSHLNFPMSWAVRSFCAGPLQGSRGMRREGTGSFKRGTMRRCPHKRRGGRASASTLLEVSP